MNEPLRVLLVDGHEGVRRALCLRLERMPQVGDMLASGSLSVALAFGRSFSPDVVLCDPKTIGGLPADAVHALGTGGSPVVVLTSSLQDGEEDALRRAGAATVLLKGCSMSELVGALEGAAAMHRGARL